MAAGDPGAVAPSTPPILLPMGLVFPVSGRQLFNFYLANSALSGVLAGAIIPGGCFVAAGLNIFSVRPDALPFLPSHRTQHGKIWGYFSADRPTLDIQQACGGYWVRYGADKEYKESSGEAFGFRRRFVFQVKQQGADRKVRWVDTQWEMKEYRLNKDTASCRRVLPNYPKANMDFVIRKVFTKPVAVAPPPLPTPSSKALRQGRSRLPPREARPPRPPKASMCCVVCESTTKPVDPSPLPARSSEETGPMNPPPPPPPPPVCSSEKGNPGSNDEGHGMERADCVVKPNGCYVIQSFLAPMAGSGKLRKGTIPGYVAEGVNIFSVKPDELPFQPSQHGEEWGYFFGARPASDELAAPGGHWVRYGPEKEYVDGIAFRRRFAFHAEWRDGDGQVRREPTRWLMKEYRFNRENVHDACRRMQRIPNANLDCVMYKVFRKPVAPPPAPAPPPPPPPVHSSEERPGSNNNPIVVDDEAGPGCTANMDHVVRPPMPLDLELSLRPPGSNSNNPVIVDDDAEPAALHRATPGHSEASNGSITCSMVDEDQMKEHCLTKDDAVFPRVQTSPKLVADMDRVVPPPPPPLDLELRLGPSPHVRSSEKAVFPREQPNPKLVANMDRVIRPPPPPLNLEQRLEPPPLDLELRLGPSPHVRSSEKAVFHREQPNPKMVANMDRVIRPPPPPLNLEQRPEPPPLDQDLRLGPPGSYYNNLSVGDRGPGEVERARSGVGTETRAPTES